MADVSRLPFNRRLRLTLEATIPKVAPELRAQLRGLLEPEALALAGGVVVVWGGMHFTGAGEIADAALLVIGYLALGGAAYEAGRELILFANGVRQAATERDINDASCHLAAAIDLLGVQAVLALLLHVRPTAFRRPPEWNAQKWNSWWQLPEAPISPKGRWVYQPTVKRVGPAEIPGAYGVTSAWGDIKISSAMSEEDTRAVLFHEQVHSFLSPKLYLLRDLRGQIMAQGYKKSVLLRYLEEAMAQTWSELRTKGLDLNALLRGVTFPIASGGYDITISGARAEAAGILLGPINVGGAVWNVWQSRKGR